MNGPLLAEVKFRGEHWVVVMVVVMLLVKVVEVVLVEVVVVAVVLVLDSLGKFQMPVTCNGRTILFKQMGRNIVKVTCETTVSNSLTREHLL